MLKTIISVVISAAFVILFCANAIKIITGLSPMMSLVITILWLVVSTPVAVLAGRRLGKISKYYKEI